jgi:hypothetical protein
VRGEAVGFHDELGLGPGEVDLVALDPAVDLRWWKTVAVDEGEEAPLELALRHLRRALSCLQELRTAATRIVVNDSYEGGQVEESPVFRFVDGSREILSAQDVGEVQEGSRQGRDRGALMHSHLIVGQPARAVDTQALAAQASRARRDRDVRQSRCARADVPVCGGISV